jgi:hypothetical protein
MKTFLPNRKNVLTIITFCISIHHNFNEGCKNDVGHSEKSEISNQYPDSASGTRPVAPFNIH